MARVKEWGIKRVEELWKEGYSYQEIADELNCDIDFVIAILETGD